MSISCQDVPIPDEVQYPTLNVAVRTVRYLDLLQIQPLQNFYQLKLFFLHVYLLQNPLPFSSAHFQLLWYLLYFIDDGRDNVTYVLFLWGWFSFFRAQFVLSFLLLFDVFFNGSYLIFIHIHLPLQIRFLFSKLLQTFFNFGEEWTIVSNVLGQLFIFLDNLLQHNNLPFLSYLF